MSENITRQLITQQVTGFVNYIAPMLIFATVWSGLVLNIMGQKKLLMSLVLFILAFPGILRYILASIITDTRNAMFYPMKPLVDQIPAAKLFTVAGKLGVPSGSVSDSGGTMYR